MLSLSLRKVAITAGIAAGASCIAYTAFAQVGTANPQGSSSVNNNTATPRPPAANGPTFSSGEYVFKFKGTTTEGLPQYEVFKGDADIGTVTQTVKGYGYKANDQATIKDTRNVPTAVTNLTHGSAYLDESANPSASFGTGANSTNGSNAASKQAIPAGAVKAPNGLYVSMEDIKDKKGKPTETIIKVVDPVATSPTGIQLEYFIKGSALAGVMTSLRVWGPSDYSGTAHTHPINLKPLGLDGNPIPGARVKTNYGGKGERIEPAGLVRQLEAIKAVSPGFGLDFKAFRDAFPDYGENPKMQKGDPRTYTPPGTQQ